MIALFLISFFLILIFTGFPLLVSMIVPSVLVTVLFGAASGMTFTSIAEAGLSNIIGNNVGLTIVIFMVAGDVMAKGKLTEKIFEIFAYFLGKKKGFMPVLSILTCMFYGAISGSGPATTAAVGAMCFPLLVKMGYDKLFSGAILVSAGCLGMVIPPSVPLTGAATLVAVNGVGMDTSVLYQIGAIVGVLAGLLLIIYSYIYCLRHGNGDQKVINEWVDELRKKGFAAVLKESIWAILTPVIVLGTIFSGYADTAQSAALSLVYSILVAVFVYKTIRIQDVPNLLTQATIGAVPILTVLGASGIFSAGMNSLGIPVQAAAFIAESKMPSMLMVLMAILLMLVLGTFMDAGGAMFIVVPMFYPIVRDLGLDPYPFIAAIIMAQAIGLCTPPYGLCLFTLCPLAGCSVGALGKKVLPMVVILILVTIAVGCIPGLFSWLTAGAVIP